MSEAIELHAELRGDLGKGASRRLRRLHNLVPAIIYGGDQKPLTISLSHNKLTKAMEHESFYSSILKIMVDGKKVTAILKDIQRHPFKPKVLHLDLQRVSMEDVIVKEVPLHFTNETTAVGVKIGGGNITHLMNHVEVKCRAKDLPEYIEVDLADLDIDQSLHLSDLKLPAGTTLTADIHDAEHNLAVVSIYTPKAEAEIEETAPVAAEVPVEGEEPSAESEQE